MIALPFTVYLTLCALRLALRVKMQCKAGFFGSRFFTIQKSRFARKEPRALSVQLCNIIDVLNFHNWEIKDESHCGGRKTVN